MTERRRVPRLAMVCAVALAALATVPAAPAAVLAGQVTNKAHKTFSTLTAAVAAAQFNDTLTVTGNVHEPGPVSLKGFTGTIKAGSLGASVTQTSPGACAGTPMNCVLDASGAGSVTIYKLRINVPDESVGILAAPNGGLSVSSPLTIKQSSLVGQDPFFGIVLVGASGGPFTIQNDTISGSIRNGIVVLGDGLTRLFVSIHDNQITNADPNADVVGIIIAFGPPTSSNTVTIYDNTIDGGGSTAAVTGIDVVFTDRAQVHDNTIQNFFGGKPSFDDAPGSALRLRQATNVTAHENTLINNRIGIQIDPESGEVSNNAFVQDTRMRSTLEGAIGLIFNAAGNAASLYSGPVDARDNTWGPVHGAGANSADGTCACGSPDPAALWVVNGTPGATACNNTPSASGGDILSCPSD